MKRKLDWKRLVSWLIGFTPVWRKTMKRRLKDLDKQYTNRIADMVKRHQEKLEKTAETADAVVKRCSSIRWSRHDCDRYRIAMDFSPRMFGAGDCTTDELRFIAERFAHLVELEIATSRFVEAELRGF